MQETVQNEQPGTEVLRQVQGDKNMEPGPYTEVAYMDSICRQYPITDQERSAFSCRIRKESYGSIGNMVGVSRQRIHQICKSFLAKLPECGKSDLLKRFPYLAGGRIKAEKARSKKDIRRGIRKFVASFTERSQVDYCEVMRHVGVDFPDECLALNEMDSCRRLHSEYGIVSFGGRIRMCSRCKNFKHLRSMTKCSGRMTSGRCKECNRAHVKEYRERKIESQNKAAD